MAEVHTDMVPTHRGHETRDFNIRVVALFAMSLAILLAGSLALMAWLLDIFEVTPEGYVPRGAPIAATIPRPPGPRLQTSPRGDMQEMLRAENARLQSYGWVDRTAGIARVPIDQAIQVVLEQGLPSWYEIPTSQNGGHSAPLEENR
jgi:hypothetical protein